MEIGFGVFCKCTMSLERSSEDNSCTLFLTALRLGNGPRQFIAVRKSRKCADSTKRYAMPPMVSALASVVSGDAVTAVCTAKCCRMLGEDELATDSDESVRCFLCGGEDKSLPVEVETLQAPSSRCSVCASMFAHTLLCFSFRW